MEPTLAKDADTPLQIRLARDTRTEADRIVEDEVLRERVRKLSSPEPITPRWEKLSRNPLVQTIVSFTLTGVLAGLLSGYWNDRRLATARAIEADRQTRETNEQALEGFTRLALSRIEASAMLNSALRRNWPLEELRARKIAYDSTYIRWNREIIVSLLTIREMMRAKEFSFVESYVDQSLKPAFIRIDTALTNAYTARVGNAGVAGAGWHPDTVRKYINGSRECVYGISTALWVEINATATNVAGRSRPHPEDVNAGRPHDTARARAGPASPNAPDRIDGEWADARQNAIRDMKRRCPKLE